MNTILVIGLLIVAVVVTVWLVRRRKATVRGHSSAVVELDTPDVRSPQGDGILISVGAPRQPLPSPHDEIRIVEEAVASAEHACGHRGTAWFVLDIYGTFTKRIDDHKKCLDCTLTYLEQHATRCALCGLAIAPGDPVALYGDSPGLKYTAVASKVETAFVGCLRWDCCPSGGFFAGVWTEAGFGSAFGGQGTAVSETARTGKMVIGNF